MTGIRRAVSREGATKLDGRASLESIELTRAGDVFLAEWIIVLALRFYQPLAGKPVTPPARCGLNALIIPTWGIFSPRQAPSCGKLGLARNLDPSNAMLGFCPSVAEPFVFTIKALGAHANSVDAGECGSSKNGMT